MVANDDDDAVPMSGHSQESRNAAVRAVVKGLDDLGAVVFFEKALTSSDASGSGRVVIPKVGSAACSCMGQAISRFRSGTGRIQLHAACIHAPCPQMLIMFLRAAGLPLACSCRLLQSSTSPAWSNRMVFL